MPQQKPEAWLWLTKCACTPAWNLFRISHNLSIFGPMKFLPGLLLSGSFLFSFAQKRPDPLPYSRVITTDSLKTHLYRLAGPEFEGRETARPGQQKAAAYIEDYFRLLGLRPGNKDSFQMSFPVFQDSL